MRLGAFACALPRVAVQLCRRLNVSHGIGTLRACHKVLAAPEHGAKDDAIDKVRRQHYLLPTLLKC